jgi:hypothetical protein
MLVSFLSHPPAELDGFITQAQIQGIKDIAAAFFIPL